VGTVSLVIGLILIGVGIYVLFIVPTFLVTNEFFWIMLIVRLVFTIPLFVIGGLLLRKYDRDRKKEK